jgi:hypothetical protein
MGLTLRQVILHLRLITIARGSTRRAKAAELSFLRPCPVRFIPLFGGAYQARYLALGGRASVITTVVKILPNSSDTQNLVHDYLRHRIFLHRSRARGWIPRPVRRTSPPRSLWGSAAPPNGWRYPLVGGTRGRRFAGTCSKPRKVPENAPTPTTIVPVLFRESGAHCVGTLLTL